MSKRDLKKYLNGLTKEQLEDQILELYEKFSPVKVYYNYVFNPKEDTLLRECKLKISQEYFPLQTKGKRKKPKMRRSIAQKYIKHFILLGVDPFIIADIMLYNIEIAQAFASENIIKQELFYKSMHNSFGKALKFIISNGIITAFKSRLVAICEETSNQKWINSNDFKIDMELLDTKQDLYN
jgi:hypothetical protein